MFGIGWTEFIIIFLVLLIFVGPRHFPELLQRFGQLVGELRAASRELRNQIDVDLKDVESPRAAAARAGRELLDSWDSPYGEDDSPSEGYAPPRLDQAEPAGTPKEEPEVEPGAETLADDSSESRSIDESGSREDAGSREDDGDNQ